MERGRERGGKGDNAFVILSLHLIDKESIRKVETDRQTERKTEGVTQLLNFQQIILTRNREEGKCVCACVRERGKEGGRETGRQRGEMSHWYYFTILN